MNPERFDELLERRIALTRKVLKEKSDAYSTKKDKLYNFKRAAEILRTTPEDALVGMWTKHLVSVLDIVSKITKENKKVGLNYVVSPFHIEMDEELIDEKIGDAINYLILLEALIQERREYCA